MEKIDNLNGIAPEVFNDQTSGNGVAVEEVAGCVPMATALGTEGRIRTAGEDLVIV